MGKLKKGRKSNRGRFNPTARKDGSTISKQDAKDETLRQTKILPLIAKLSSSASNDRSVALSAITVLVEDARMRRILLKEKLVPTVMEQTLNDVNDELVVESFGLLRNLTIEEGYDVAKYLWRSNIWAPIEKGLVKIENSLQYMKSDTKAMDKKIAYMLFEFIENILSLTVLIASCSDDLYDSIYAKVGRITGLVIDLLNWNVEKLKTTKLFNALLDFVYEFASDSADFVKSLAATPEFSLPAIAEALSQNAHESNNLGKLYLQGIQFHFLEINGDPSHTKDAACVQILTSILNTITNIDIEQVAKNLSATDNAAEPIQKTELDEKPKDIDVAFGGEAPEKTMARADLQAIEIAIDLITSICEYLAINEADFKDPVDMSDDLINLLLNTVFPSCMHLLVFDKDHSQVLQLSTKLLVCLNNLCWLFLSNASIPVEWFSKLPSLWQICEHTTRSPDREVQKLSLSILWAISKSVGPEIRDKVSLAEVAGLLDECNTIITNISAETESVSIDLDFLLSAVGFLGTIAQVIGSVDITRQISDFLLNLIGHFSDSNNNLKQSKAQEIPIECINLIYDIFGDCNYDYDEPVFVQGNYLENLRNVEPKVKSLYKQIDKNRNGALKARAEEAWINLGRFIDYKVSERS